MKLGLGAELAGSSTKETSNYLQNVTETSSSQSVSVTGVTVPWTGEANEVVSGQIDGSALSMEPFADATTPGIFPEWHLDELLHLTDIDKNYGFTNNGALKVLHDLNCKHIYLSAFLCMYST